MPPLADTMRLVDHEQRDGTVAHEVAQVAVERFRGEEHQLVLPGTEGIHARTAFVELQCGVDRGHGESQPRDGIHLVLHQRDERRDHEHGSVEQSRRQLVRERLARSGWHQRDTVLAGQHRVDDFTLPGPELVKPEDIAEDGFGGTGRGGMFVGQGETCDRCATAGALQPALITT